MRALAFVVLGALTGHAAAGDTSWIRVRVGDTPLLFRADGTREPAAIAAPPQGQLSPDGTRIIRLSGQAIHLAGADGKNVQQISPDKMIADWPNWSPDGKRIAFVGMCGKHWQVHVMDRDGGNVRQLTDDPNGAWRPQFGPDGRLAYLSWHKPFGKLQPADLLIVDGRATKTAVQKVFILDYAWSPDGTAIAYSKLGALVFHDLATDAEQEVAFPDIDKRLDSHAALRICWRPDSQAVACSVVFLGGRQQGGPAIFGDEEVFVIPRRGKPTWFRAGRNVEEIEWVKRPG